MLLVYFSSQEVVVNGFNNIAECLTLVNLMNEKIESLNMYYEYVIVMPLIS